MAFLSALCITIVALADHRATKDFTPLLLILLRSLLMAPIFTILCLRGDALPLSACLWLLLSGTLNLVLSDYFCLLSIQLTGAVTGTILMGSGLIFISLLQPSIPQFIGVAAMICALFLTSLEDRSEIRCHWGGIGFGVLASIMDSLAGYIDEQVMGTYSLSPLTCTMLHLAAGIAWSGLLIPLVAPQIHQFRPTFSQMKVQMGSSFFDALGIWAFQVSVQQLGTGRSLIMASCSPILCHLFEGISERHWPLPTLLATGLTFLATIITLQT